MSFLKIIYLASQMLASIHNKWNTLELLSKFDLFINQPTNHQFQLPLIFIHNIPQDSFVYVSSFFCNYHVEDVVYTSNFPNPLTQPGCISWMEQILSTSFSSSLSMSWTECLCYPQILYVQIPTPQSDILGGADLELVVPS